LYITLADQLAENQRGWCNTTKLIFQNASTRISLDLGIVSFCTVYAPVRFLSGMARALLLSERLVE
jgi:hypothetical protein